MPTSTKKSAAKRSGNPATRAAASSVSDFKKRKKGIIVELPTGLFITLQRVELRTFVSRGEIPNSLIPIVMDSLEKGSQPDMSQVVGENANMDLIKDIYEMIGAIVCASAVNPKVYPIPAEGEERDDELVYVDDLDDEDMMFIFQWAVGGTSDLERFRKELEGDMATLAEVAGGEVSTE